MAADDADDVASFAAASFDSRPPPSPPFQLCSTNGPSSWSAAAVAASCVALVVRALALLERSSNTGSFEPHRRYSSLVVSCYLTATRTIVYDKIDRRYGI